MTQPKALLLAAGIGSRLAPLTDVLPKCLMPIGGKPLLGYWLEMLRQAEVTDIVVNLHHHAELVRDYIARSRFAASVTTSFEAQLLGTGGTLLNHRARFSKGPTLLAHADNLTYFSPRCFFKAHHARPANAVMTMMTFVTDQPRQCGILELGEGDTVVAMHEKSENPPGNLANAAVYVVEPVVIEFMATLGRPVIDFSTEVLPHFMGRIHTFHNDRYHRDIGTVASLVRAQFEFPLIAGVADAGDPWCGLMSEDGGRLAHAFMQSVYAALDQAGQG
jgi:mannose-1-phosphate guanylyltransferase